MTYYKQISVNDDLPVDQIGEEVLTDLGWLVYDETKDNTPMWYHIDEPVPTLENSEQPTWWLWEMSEEDVRKELC